MSNTLHKLLIAPMLLGATVFATAATAQTPSSTAETQEAQADSVAHVVDSAPSVKAPNLIAQVSAEQAAPAASADTPSLSQVQSYSNEGQITEQDQVTSVSQLTDVRPTDWAFQALQSLVERYGCIAGYPDRTYRGNRALTRYEFAAGVNACLDRVNELIAAGTADLVKKEDLDALRKLQDEFAAELATLRGQVDALEARTATLEKQQFSTTTKLNGEVIFAIGDTFGDSTQNTGDDDNTETFFSDRVRLALDTSFTGKDRLRTRLQARNTPSLSGGLTGTNMTRLSFDGDNGNTVEVDKLYYRFSLGDNLRIQIDAINDEMYDSLISSLSPIESSGSGSISRFGRFNPVLRLNNPGSTGSAGIAFQYKFGDALRLEGGYFSDVRSNDPTPKNGLFNGGYTAAAQLVFTPGNLTAGLFYAHSYYPGNEVNLTGSTGSAFAQRPFGAVATSADTVGASLQFKLSPQFIIGGWFGASFVDQESGIGNNDATVLNGAAYVAFPDLLKEGNLGAILVGVPPKVTDNDIAAREDDDTSLHIEAFYRYRLNDNIAITPGIFVILNPEHNDNNDTQFVGVVRTTFTF